MRLATEVLLRTTPWSRLSSASGTASEVPGAVRALVLATDPPSAERAYWSHLDNEVIVQGTLYEAASHVVAPLCVEIFGGNLTSAARRYAVELLTEIALAVPDHESEGGEAAEIAARCRHQLERSLVGFYSLLDAAEPEVRSAAVFILSVVELDTERLRSLFTGLDAGEYSPMAQRRLAEFGPP